MVETPFHLSWNIIRVWETQNSGRCSTEVCCVDCLRGRRRRQESGSASRQVWWWWLFYPGLLEQSPLVPGLHFALLCGSLPLPPVFQKACHSFSLVWYCWRAVKEQVSKSTMGPFPPHPSNELSGTNSSIVLGRTLDVSSRHWRVEEWAMARAGLGVG